MPVTSPDSSDFNAAMDRAYASLQRVGVQLDEMQVAGGRPRVWAESDMAKRGTWRVGRASLEESLAVIDAALARAYASVEQAGVRLDEMQVAAGRPRVWAESDMAKRGISRTGRAGALASAAALDEVIERLRVDHEQA